MNLLLWIKERFVNWLLRGVHIKDAKFGDGTITLTSTNQIRWSAAGTAPATLDIGMNAAGAPIWNDGVASQGAALASVAGNSGTAAIGPGVVVYVGNGGGQSATENDVVVLAPRTGTLRNLRSQPATNTLTTAATTLAVMVNNLATAVTTSHAAGGVTLQSDIVNTAAVTAGQRISFRVTVAGGGAGAVSLIGLGVEIV